MDIEIIGSLVPAIGSLVTAILTRVTSETVINNYHKISVELAKGIAKLTIPVYPKPPATAKATSIVGLYYKKKRESISISMLFISIASLFLYTIRKIYDKTEISGLMVIGLIYFAILLLYYIILTYRMQTGQFGTTDFEVRELLTFIYKNGDYINDNNIGNGGRKLNVFDTAPASNKREAPLGNEGEVRA